MNQTSDANFCSTFLEDNFSKVFSLVFSLLASVLLFPLLYGIIWFERFGTDFRRNLNNRLMSAIMWRLIVLLLALHYPNWIQFAFKTSFNWRICAFLDFSAAILFMQGAMLSSSIMIVKYLSVFHLKNPGAIKDDFWSLFLNIWIISSTLTVNGVNLILPGRFASLYEVCTCKLQEDTGQPEKFKGSVTVLTVACVAIFVVTSVRIKCFKHRKVTPTSSSDLPMTSPTIATLTTSASTSLMTSQAMKNYELLAGVGVTLAAGFLIILLMLFSSLLEKSLAPENVAAFPVHVFVHFHYLVMIPLCLGLYVAFFYARHKNVAKVLLREWMA